jgi:hypothetical protein
MLAEPPAPEEVGMHLTKLARWTKGRKLWTLKYECSFGSRATLDRKVLSLSCYSSKTTGNKQISVNQICTFSRESLQGSSPCTPDYWPEVSMNTEGPETGQKHRGLPWFVLSVQKTLSSCANSTLLRASHARAPKLPSKFRHNVAPAIAHIRIPPKCSSCPILFLCCLPRIVNLSPGLPHHNPPRYPVSSVTLPEWLARHLLENSGPLTSQLFCNLPSAFSSIASCSLSHISISFTRCEVLSQAYLVSQAQSVTRQYRWLFVLLTAPGSCNVCQRLAVLSEERLLSLLISQEFLRILYSPLFCYCIHTRSPPDRMPRQMTPRVSGRFCP